jgi:hypothetical protein
MGTCMFEGYKSESRDKETEVCCVSCTGKQVTAVCRNRSVLLTIIAANHTFEQLSFFFKDFRMIAVGNVSQ